MKKRVSFTAVAVIATSVAFAQTKKQNVPPPPPPAPPVVAMQPAPAPPPPAKAEHELPAAYKAFLKRNPNVKSLGWSKGNVVRVHLKSGGEEVYHMNNQAEAEKLESKYGQLPAPPPPPPAPVPPIAPKAPEEGKG